MRTSEGGGKKEEGGSREKPREEGWGRRNAEEKPQ